jgi:hypothetical protein
VSAAQTALINEIQQGIVNDVLGSRAGKPEDVVRDALVRSFLSHGLEAPPDTWLTNVALCISEGHTYIVSSHG